MALGSTQPLTEMSVRNLPGGKGQSARKADLTAIFEPSVKKMSEPRRLTALRASMACYTDSLSTYVRLASARTVGRILFRFRAQYMREYAHFSSKMEALQMGDNKMPVL
jgi:hypothetical protein